MFKYSGWGELFKFKTSRGTVTSVGSATPAILMVLVAFGLPSQFQFWPFQVIFILSITHNLSNEYHKNIKMLGIINRLQSIIVCSP